MISVLLAIKTGGLVLFGLASILLLVSRGWMYFQHNQSIIPSLSNEAGTIPFPDVPSRSVPTSVSKTGDGRTSSLPVSPAPVESLNTQAAALPKPSAPRINWEEGGVCPPLSDITIDELPSIVSLPYNPLPPGYALRHEGVDFAFYRQGTLKDIRGLAIHAILPGKIAGVVNNRLPYGNTIIVETNYQDLPKELAEVLRITPDTSLYHLYAHMKNPPQLVIGNTGTTIAHLHLETRRGSPGKTFSTMAYNDVSLTEVEKYNFLYWSISGVFQHFDPMSVFAAFQRYIENITP
jgi:murein DD-endopeptidase MepM/ murein hydrolase activator NlpD